MSLAHAVVDAFDEQPTLDAVLAALAEGLRASDPSLLHDIDPRDVVALQARLSRRRRAPTQTW